MWCLLSGQQKPFQPLRPPPPPSPPLAVGWGEVQEEGAAGLVWSPRFPLKVFSFNLFLKRFCPEVTDHIGAVFRLSDHLIKLKSIQHAPALLSLCPPWPKVSSVYTHTHTPKNPIPGGCTCVAGGLWPVTPVLSGQHASLRAHNTVSGRERERASETN